MGKVNYMGGKLSVARTCSKDVSSRIQKRHFGQQRLRTLSECLQSINNPSSSIIPDPISGIRLGHARRKTARHELGSNSSISGQRYRSYIPPPSRISSETSDSMDAKRQLSAKIKASKMLVELARVERLAVSLDYQRKRILETPDLAGLVERRRRMESSKKCNSSKTRVPNISSGEESEREATIWFKAGSFLIAHADISDISSCHVSEVYQDSIGSWDESNIPNRGTSSVSPVCSFSRSPVARLVLEQNTDCPKSEANDMDSNGSDKENAHPTIGNPTDLLLTSDSVILRAEQRRVSSASNKTTVDFNPNAISMSDEWIAFSKHLDISLYRHKMLENRTELYPPKEVLFLRDPALGLDFYVLPRLSSKKRFQMDSITMESVPSSPYAKNTLRLANSPLPAQLTIAQNVYANSDLPSILLSCIPSPPDLCFNPIPPASFSDNDHNLVISPAPQTANSQGKHKDDCYDSRNQWDQLMDELLEPASSPSCKPDSSSRRNPSHNLIRSPMKSPGDSLPFQPLEMTPSDDQSIGPSNDVDKPVRTDSDKPLMIPVQTKATRGFFTGPLLFAFTSDLESE